MKKNKLTLQLKKSKKSKKTEQKLLPVIDIVMEDDDVTLEVDASVVIADIAIENIIVDDKDQTEKKPLKKIKPKEREHYVNGKEFEEEIRGFYNTDHVTIKLGECINKIANGLSYAPNFINYSYKEDMVGDAIVKMFSALKNKKFRLDSGFSPFSYFTTIAFHAFINRIKKEKKHHKAITEYREKVYNELMLNTEENGGAHIYVDPSHNDDDY
jgi:hypothetical protein